MKRGVFVPVWGTQLAGCGSAVSGHPAWAFLLCVTGMATSVALVVVDRLTAERYLLAAGRAFQSGKDSAAVTAALLDHHQPLLTGVGADAISVIRSTAMPADLPQ